MMRSAFPLATNNAASQKTANVADTAAKTPATPTVDAATNAIAEDAMNDMPSSEPVTRTRRARRSDTQPSRGVRSILRRHSTDRNIWPQSKSTQTHSYLPASGSFLVASKLASSL